MSSRLTKTLSLKDTKTTTYNSCLLAYPQTLICDSNEELKEKMDRCENGAFISCKRLPEYYLRSIEFMKTTYLINSDYQTPEVSNDPDFNEEAEEYLQEAEADEEPVDGSLEYESATESSE